MQVLKHCLVWATHCSRDKNYFYTKNDANVAMLLYQAVKELEQEQYKKYKRKDFPSF
jgi:hypothetical protein